MPTASPGKSVSKKPAEKTAEKPAAKQAKPAEKPVKTVAKAVETKAETKPAAKTPEPVKAAAKPAPAPAAPAAKAAAAAPAAPAKPAGPLNIDYDGFLAKLTPKDRLNIERHITAVEEISTKAHAKLWKRLAVLMMSMAPHSAKANGQQSMQFYIQDGKYRKQIFAIEDLRDGTMHVYAADAIDEAIKLGMILKPKATDEPDQFKLPNSTDILNVERLDGRASNPAPFYKDMLGWNRRAIHVILPVMASDAIGDLVAKLLEMGARKDGAIA